MLVVDIDLFVGEFYRVNGGGGNRGTRSGEESVSLERGAGVAKNGGFGGEREIEEVGLNSLSRF